ncbi:MAG: hypothetical protein RL605_1081 [Actinomycetota bacterium]|jgi:O-succinylbenzoic acid--CoA ligase
MTRPLKLVAANDTFAALLAVGEVLAGRQALFVTAPEVNGLMPEVHGLPSDVDDSVAVIVESSGSTGTPKRIELSTEALVASATAAHNRLGGPGQWLLALPINFVAGLNVLVRSLVAETQPILMNATLPFTADGFARAASLMTGERRYTSLVPTQLERLARELPFNDFLLAQLRRFDAILVGGQAVNPATLRDLRAAGVNVVETYGMTETCGGCVYDGKALDGVAVRLADDGSIVIAGPTLCNSAAESGEFVTSDRGEFDADGRLLVLGRADRVIASGGIKLSLDRVEQFAATVVGVTEVAATALADPEWGQRVGIAYVGSPEVADSIAQSLAETLGPAGKPVRVIRVDKLPKLASGKPDLIATANLFEESRG